MPIPVTIKLKDGELGQGNDYTFYVTFINTAPVFTNAVPSELSIKLESI